MFGNGLLLGCHLSFVIYEGVALGDMLKKLEMENW
jgi:hypothetical protein